MISSVLSFDVIVDCSAWDSMWDEYNTTHMYIGRGSERVLLYWNGRAFYRRKDGELECVFQYDF